MISNEKPKKRHRIDWRLAADLLAQGLPLEVAADRLGCAVRVLRRNLRRSPVFRRRIEQAAEQQRLMAQLRFMALGEHAVLHLQQAEKLDARTLQWLGTQIGLERLGPKLDGDIAARWEVALGLQDKDRLLPVPEGQYRQSEIEEMLAETRAEMAQQAAAEAARRQAREAELEAQAAALGLG